MIDAVISLHMNPLTCGVAKWNHALAKRLGVPCLAIGSVEADLTFHPLVSVKPSEGDWPQGYKAFDLFLHGTPTIGTPLYRPTRIYAANREIADAIRHCRPDVIEAFCPGTVEGDPTRGVYQVLAFGMSNKLQLPHFARLREQLEREHPQYTINLSTAVHEGTPWDGALTTAIDGMREIFGHKLRVLGFLGDDALARELHNCDAVAVFFSPALRANNTSAWAAVAAGKKLYTNTDDQSPALDAEMYSWSNLVELIRG